MPKKIFVANKMDIPPGILKLVEIEGESIVLINHKNKIYALEDICPHEGAPLSEGRIENNKIACPWHNASFEIKSGKVLSGPTETDVKMYKVTEDGEKIFIEL